MDPLSPHTLPPARYTLESDSEDEEGEGLYPHSEAVKRTPKTAPKARVRTELTERPERVVVAVGEAADYLEQLVDGQTAGQVDVDDHPVGRVIELGGAQIIVLFAADVQHEACHAVAKELLTAFPVPFLAVSTYSPPSYISLEAGVSRGYAPIRSLSTSQPVALGKGIEAYKNPNYITGLAAALLSSAAHPASNRSLTALLLPLSLATLAPSDVVSAISPFATRINGGQHLSDWELKPHQGHRSRATEDSQSMYV